VPGQRRHTNQQKYRWKKEGKKLLIRVPPQRPLAISRLRVPNLDGFVATAAGNLFSIGTPRHSFDTEIVRSQEKQSTAIERGKLGEKEFGKNKRYESECPATPKYYIFKSSKFVSMFEHACLSKNKPPFRVAGLTGAQRGKGLGF